MLETELGFRGNIYFFKAEETELDFIFFGAAKRLLESSVEWFFCFSSIFSKEEKSGFKNYNFLLFSNIFLLSRGASNWMLETITESKKEKKESQMLFFGLWR